MTTVKPVLNQVADGDPQAAEQLVDRFGGLVWTLAQRMCRDHAEAEDATQEIMAEIWNSVQKGRFDPSKGSEATFVATIARRRLIDRLRRRKTPFTELPPGLADSDEANSPAFRLDVEDEQVRAAMAVLDELSEAQQRTIRLAVMQGLTHEQVAQVTGLPLGTVKTHIRRGLIRMRQRLHELKKGGVS
ncbi:MAG: sigma-70 family RNA polymerase sigma factor [Planctomycetota bacterium]|nr:MAG: sigma-70 family RNA polymerase sigma factor [Planctomycetota bacterium]